MLYRLNTPPRSTYHQVVCLLSTPVLVPIAFVRMQVSIFPSTAFLETQVLQVDDMSIWAVVLFNDKISVEKCRVNVILHNKLRIPPSSLYKVYKAFSSHFPLQSCGKTFFKTHTKQNVNV